MERMLALEGDTDALPPYKMPHIRAGLKELDISARVTERGLYSGA